MSDSFSFKVNGQPVPLSVSLADVMRSARNGFDVGNLTNGIALKISSSDTEAVLAAWQLLEPRLRDFGIDSEELLWETIGVTQFSSFAQEFRRQLADFFPVIGEISNQVQGEISNALNALNQSGQVSLSQPESLESTPQPQA